MNPATVAFVHKCLNVSFEASRSIISVEEMTNILKQWVKKKWEPKHKGADISLNDMCIPGTIWTMATALEQLHTLDEKLPNSYNICRDDGIIIDGARQPCPCINDYTIPAATQVCDILEQIRNVFKWILLMKKLLDVAVPASFWEEVAGVRGRDIEHAKSQWRSMEETLGSSITDIESFVQSESVKSENPVREVGGEKVVIPTPARTLACMSNLLVRLRGLGLDGE
jgi:hypothetical protein